MSLHAFARYPVNGNFSHSLKQALEDYRQRLELKPKAIFVNGLNSAEAVLYTTNNQLDIEVIPFGGCLKTEIWLEM